MEIELTDFTGCKIALFCEDKLLTILRDDKPSIPWPNMWELPGGGREGDESPFECAAREVFEELGIHLRQEQFDSIVFGDEGQDYKLMSIDEFLGSDKVVPQLQDRVRDYMESNYD